MSFSVDFFRVHKNGKFFSLVIEKFWSFDECFFQLCNRTTCCSIFWLLLIRIARVVGRTLKAKCSLFHLKVDNSKQKLSSLY